MFNIFNPISEKEIKELINYKFEPLAAEITILNNIEKRKTIETLASKGLDRSGTCKTKITEIEVASFKKLKETYFKIVYETRVKYQSGIKNFSEEVERVKGMANLIDDDRTKQYAIETAERFVKILKREIEIEIKIYKASRFRSILGIIAITLLSGITGATIKALIDNLGK